jgi:hypothetical protein
VAEIEVRAQNSTRPRPVEIEVRRRDWPHHGAMIFRAGPDVNL